MQEDVALAVLVADDDVVAVAGVVVAAADGVGYVVVD